MTHLTNHFSFATDNQQNWRLLMTIWTWQLVIASQRYRGPTNIRWFPARNHVMVRWGCLSWNRVFTICSTTRGPPSYVRTPTDYGYILLYVLFKPHMHYLLTKQPSSTRNGNPHLVRVFCDDGWWIGSPSGRWCRWDSNSKNGRFTQNMMVVEWNLILPL